MGASEHASNSARDGAEHAYDRFRADTYGLLGALLSAAPDTALLGWLGELQPDGESDAPMAAAWRTLAQAAQDARTDTLAEEFQTLFIGLGKGEVVPYASWYLTGFLMERPLAAVRQDLQALGLATAEDRHEPEDHAGTLCQVMAILADPDEGWPAERQRSFFEAHLKGWYARLFDDLRTAPSARFYAAVGQFGATFLDLEALHLEA